MAYPVELKNDNKYNYQKYPPVGIDLGTSNSSAAYFIKTNQTRGVFNYTFNVRGYNDRNKLFPSVVYLDESESQKNFISGRSAFSRRFTEPENVVLAVKRKIGDNGKTINLNGVPYSPVEIHKEVVKGILDDLLTGSLESPAGLVITVPYYFTQNQNHNTRLAVESAIEEIFENRTEVAKPKLLALLPEPIAAALYYLRENARYTFDRTILVFDLGGGTLDITIVDLKVSNQQLEFEVLASTGSSQMGGEDFDQILYEYIIKKESVSFAGLDERGRKQQRARILNEVRLAKEALSGMHQKDFVVVNLPNQSHIDSQLTRKEFEELLAGKKLQNGRNFLKEIAGLLGEAHQMANKAKSEIDNILLVGGSSQIPILQSLLQSTFSNADLVSSNDHTYFSVSRGAAIYAAYILDKEYGHQHHPFDKSIDRVSVMARTSHNLGVETYNGRFNIIVPAQTKVPVTEKKLYHPLSYAGNDRSKVELAIKVYQGNEENVKDNTLIGRLAIEDIYTHGRLIEKDELPVEITFHVAETTVDVEVYVKQGNQDKTDIQYREHISLLKK